MILYFSGTGNSAYVARKLGVALHDEVVDLLPKIKAKEESILHSQTPWVIVSPTYAWRIPHIVHDWLTKAELQGNKEIYFVMTCGGSIANAGSYLEKLCIKKGLSYRGCMPILMPENYIALYDVPTLAEASHIIKQADKTIQEVADILSSKQTHGGFSSSISDKLRSGIVNRVFYPTIVHSTKFYATDACIACGNCVQHCPLNNIKIIGKQPQWGKHCTHCMACINRCPKEAIEYGHKSIGKRRYSLPNNG